MIDILLMMIVSNVQNFADSLQGFDVVQSVRRSPRIMYIVLITKMTYVLPTVTQYYFIQYYWNYISYLILEAHIFLEMSWSIILNTHENAGHKKYKAIILDNISLVAMPKLLFLVRCWIYVLGKPRIFLFEYTCTAVLLIMTIYYICSYSPNTFCYS